MLRVAVRERVVSPPWIREKLAGTREITVGQESGLEPEAGPLELYRSVWPERYVAWNVRRQLWEVRQLNPVTGQDERYELVFEWGVAPNEEAPWGVLPEDLDAETLEQRKRRRSLHLVRCYRHFDYRFVRERIRQRAEFYEDLVRHADAIEGHRRFSERIAARNRARGVAKMRDFAREYAAGLNEIRRWIPYISGAAAKRPAHAPGLSTSE